MKSYNYFEIGKTVPQNGDIIELRDFAKVTEQWSYEKKLSKWQLQPYRLIDGTIGNMIATDFVSQNDGDLPPQIDIPLNLEGIYKIYLSMPVLEKAPFYNSMIGIDISLNDDDFINMGPEYGSRRGRYLVEKEREIWCYFKTARLDFNSILKLRVLFNSHLSQPLGRVRSIISAIRFEKADELYKNDENAKPVIIVCDGFSHYWEGAKPGNGIDTRLPQSCVDSDTKIIMLQSPSTGITAWKSRVTSYIGEDLTDKDRKGKRSGDLRTIDYVKWAIDNKQEGMRIMPSKCLKSGIAFHFSIRANLFMTQDTCGKFANGGIEKLFNGRFWHEHQELLNKKGGLLEDEIGKKLNFALKESRQFIINLYKEVLDEFDYIDGINLDLTRWPPVLDIERHDFEVLPTFLREIREMLDDYEIKLNKKLEFSINIVEGYHAKLSFEEQKIDYEKILQTKTLDFICVQAWDVKKYSSLARSYQIPYFAIRDGDSIYYKNGSSDDPLWVLSNGEMQDDPIPGEEHIEQPPIKNCFTPQELYMDFAKKYQEGADGACIVNRFMDSGCIRNIGHVDEVIENAKSGKIYGQEYGQYIFRG